MEQRSPTCGAKVVALFGHRRLADASPKQYSQNKFDENGQHVQLLETEAARWLRRASTTKTAATMRGYAFNLGRFVEFVGGVAALDAVTVDNCEDWSVSLGLEAGSLKSAQAEPRSFFRACVAKGLLDVSPWDSIPNPKPRPNPTGRTVGLTEDDREGAAAAGTGAPGQT